MSHALVLLPPVALPVTIRPGNHDKLALGELGHNRALFLDDALTLCEEYGPSFGRAASWSCGTERTPHIHINPL